MNNNYLLIDVSNLAHRALHTVGDLHHPDDPEQYTGVLFQIWQTCELLASQYRTQNIAFFFDSKQSKRASTYPKYKTGRLAAREKETKVQQEQRKGMHAQILALPRLFHQMGVVNFVGQTGYEADDLIASAIQSNANNEYIIVSSDQDLYQVLADNVKIHKPTSKIAYTLSDFTKEYGVYPTQWADVKAWAGCASDSIDGLPGVGDKTACKYINGTLNKDSKIYGKFHENLELFNRNVQLVRLPYPGTQKVVLQPQVAKINWRVLVDYIGAVPSITDEVYLD